MFEISKAKLSEDGVVLCRCDQTNLSWIPINGIATDYRYDNMSIIIRDDILYLVFCNIKKYYGPNTFENFDRLTSGNDFIIDEEHKLYQLCVDIRNFVKRIRTAFEYAFNKIYSYEETEKIDRRFDVTKSESQINVVYYHRDRIQFLPKNITFNIDSDFLEKYSINDMVSSLIHQFSDKVIQYQLPNKSARN